MDQLSKKTDKTLNVLSRRIGVEQDVIAKATKKFDSAWEEVFNLFLEFGLEDGARFIASDGFVLARQKSQRSPKLDEELLRQRIFSYYKKAQANKVWAAITEPRVNVALLEKAVMEGGIAQEIVEECLTTPEPTFSRVRKEWTKVDAERAFIYGIELEKETKEP